MKTLLMLTLICISHFAIAANGIFAINDTCFNFGCFPGDSGGHPITITQPGSYQLTSNIISVSNTSNIIEINADNVTLDLNGFSIIGPRTCTGDNASLVCSNSGMTANAIFASARKNITVKNGMTKGFNTGVKLESLNQRGNKVMNITSSENEFGIVVIKGVIENSMAMRNLDTGFSNGLLGTLMLINSAKCQPSCRI